ncbi:carbohydrate ABC transporter permease [Pseudonocardia sp.]|jgi:ABC-type glycerol-3-phosphate transport system permease component|uniref:carbohydrate ABC transporter permease n=1 Tax=Pseudonocardia sp. TaxID=60912 RepID=UPI0026267CC8|nr:carbohydrate ABC transporter permease [Pseudonocardia sp.]MCW2722375.1 carbohydrate transporter permease [Pseudonocardia sp.]MDT7615338.1 polyol transport system permease protein [Pseudonocardiales bacterium]
MASITATAALRSDRVSPRKRPSSATVAGRIGLLLWIALSAVPLLFMVITSFKPQNLALANPPVWKFAPTGSNYTDILQGTGGAPNMAPLLVHGLIVTGVVTVFTVAFGALAGYGLTIKTFRQRRFLSSWILSTYMFPSIVTVVPVFFFESNIGVLGTYPGIIIPEIAFNLPIVVWLVRRGVEDIPIEIEEAAMLDGLSRIGILRRIALPLAMPSISASFIVTAILVWNEFTFSLMLTSSATEPAPAAVLQLTGMYGTQWGLLCAASVAIAAPAILLALVARRRLVSGLTFGAVK